MVMIFVMAVSVKVSLFLCEIVSDVFSEIVSLISYFCGSHCILVGCGK